jgi:2-polyprenyl-3-methyl-5-hydroxy-6-metoxy-1,4-benzoquinol methylase
MASPQRTTAIQFLESLFASRFTVKQLHGVSESAFSDTLRRMIGSVNGESEGFLDPAKQRDLSVKFHWGHNHDFGNGLVLGGNMQNRHIEILAYFISEFGLPTDLRGKRVLDIGVWTGGTSLLLAAMGAQVTALEEVGKYADTVNYLARSFGVQHQLRCLPRNLYDALPMFADEFDYVIYSGVIYHVSDPLLSLRLVFSALKNGGKCFVETAGLDAPDSICRYEGPDVVHSGNAADLTRTGWNYYIPSASCLRIWCRDAGFQSVEVSGIEPASRLLACAQRTQFQDLCRAGLAQAMCR